MALKRARGEQSAMKELQGFVDMLTGESSDADLKKDQRHPYSHLEKTVVLQEARIFHDSKAVREHPGQCCLILAQLLRLKDSQKQPFSETEATDIFFGATKLFVSDDASLRRMVYLFLKEIYSLCDPNNVIIVTSSLTKDMTCDVDLYRANALRVLARIIDSSMLGAIERYVKQAIVDKSHTVASGALVSAVHLYDASPDNAVIVRRWINETQQAILSRDAMVQFHGMQLLYKIKSHDRLGVSKLVSQYSKHKAIRSPLALVLLLRYTEKLMRDDLRSGRTARGVAVRDGSALYQESYEFLRKGLTHKVDMVKYEAARAICALLSAAPEDVSPAIAVLQAFLQVDHKPAVRYASMRTLSAVAETNPRLVSRCNDEMQTLIQDPSRQVATLAVTTLLKTGSEDTIATLLEAVSSFLETMDDDNRISVVDSLQRLCLRYPGKHLLLISFMSRFLRERGGFEFKRAIVHGIVDLIRAIPEIAESALFQLCEYIEDCEYLQLSTEIIHVLGELGPAALSSADYIPYIYNRMILEQHEIRSAGVMALFQFAAKCPSLRTSIFPLLRRSLNEDDDETRDRAALAVSVMEQAMKEFPYSTTTVHDDDEEDGHEFVKDAPSSDDPAIYVLSSLPMTFDKLERSVRAYQSNPGDMSSPDPVTLASLPIIEDTPEESNALVEEGESVMVDGQIRTREEEKPVDPAAVIYAIPELASLGHVFRSCPPISLTESESEYIVQCIKHVLPEHVVLQFIVENTIEDQRLDDVNVAVSVGDEGLFEAIGEIAANGIGFGDTQSCFTVLKRDRNVTLSHCTFECELHFRATAMDDGEEIGESIDEEFALDRLDVFPSDFVAKVSVPDFRQAWEGAGHDNEVIEKFQLPFKSREDAVAALLRLLGMHACDGTGTVTRKDKPHMLHLSGVFVGGHPVLIRAQVSTHAEDDMSSKIVILKIAVRSDQTDVSRKVLGFIS